MHSTIRDVASAAGVSKATVSRVLNGHATVDAILTGRVHAAAQQLGYRPNGLARSLRMRATTVIEMVIADVTNPFFTAMVRGVEDAAQAAGYSVVLANADEDLAKEARYIEVAAAERMAGVIMCPASETDTRVELLLDRGIPVIAVDRRLRTAAVDSVTVNNRAASRDAVAHLLAQGCRRIGLIGGLAGTTTSNDRHAGYRDALRQGAVPMDIDLVVDGGFRIDGGYEATLGLMRRREPPDGLFIANNLMTLGAVGALADAELRFPQDVAVVGFDDVPWADPLRGRMSVVSQPAYDMGRRAAGLLLRRIQGEDFPPQRLVLPATLRIGASSVRRPG